MELRDYILILAKRWWLVLVAVVFSLGIFSWAAFRETPKYEAVASISVLKQSEVPSVGTVYEFDNFYNLQANQLITDLMLGWLEESATVAEIYEKANVVLPKGDIKNYDKLILYKKLHGTSVLVITEHPNKAEAEALAATAVETLADRIETLETQGIESMSTVLSEPISQLVKPALLLTIVMGGLFGLLVGGILVFLLEYITTPPRR